jgi:leucyl aminopeptidase (aminopeptidase T)
MDMVESAKGALKWVLNLKSGENVLVVTDKQRLPIGSAFRSAAEEMGAKSEVFVLPEQKRPFQEVPRSLLGLLEKRDIIINTLSSSAEETPFRIKLIKAGITTGARVGHGPGITEDMMTEGPMSADHRSVAELAKKLMNALLDASSIHVMAPGGTDVTLSVKGRPFQTDMEITPGRMGNLPPGEIWCAPIEDGADGVIVSDGSIGDLGQVPSPVTIKVKRGRIESTECKDSGFLKRLKELTSVDEMASVIGELGIGINPKARITGILLEDEKAWKTAHIAFGNNETMPGGKNNSKTHRDFLFNLPTILVTYGDGKKKTVMKDGDLAL